MCGQGLAWQGRLIQDLLGAASDPEGQAWGWAWGQVPGQSWEKRAEGCWLSPPVWATLRPPLCLPWIKYFRDVIGWLCSVKVQSFDPFFFFLFKKDCSLFLK